MDVNRAVCSTVRENTLEQSCNILTHLVKPKDDIKSCLRNNTKSKRNINNGHIYQGIEQISSMENTNKIVPKKKWKISKAFIANNCFVTIQMSLFGNTGFHQFVIKLMCLDFSIFDVAEKWRQAST